AESIPIPVVTVPVQSKTEQKPKMEMKSGLLAQSKTDQQAKKEMKPGLLASRKTKPSAPAQTADSPNRGIPVFDLNGPNAFSSSPSPKQAPRSDNAFARPMPEGYGQAMAMTGGMAMPMGYPVYENGMGAMASAPAGANGMIPAQVYGQGYGNEMMVPYQASAPGYSPPVQQMAYTIPLPPEAEYWLSVLHDSLYPSQREWAAETLTMFDCRVFPVILDTLVTAARVDPAATVRAACVRCLARMRVNRPDVVSTVADLKNDADPRVQQEANEA